MYVPGCLCFKCSVYVCIFIELLFSGESWMIGTHGWLLISKQSYRGKKKETNIPIVAWDFLKYGLEITST